VRERERLERRVDDLGLRVGQPLVEDLVVRISAESREA
jgi:hypothetical protein